MNSFERFGLTHLSPSSLNLWRSGPGLWGLRYLAKVKDGGNAAMWRGSAVENGLAAFLRGADHGTAISNAHTAFNLNCAGEASDENTAEHELIAPMLRQCFTWQPPSVLNAAQIKVQHWFDDIPIPVVGYLDFAFDGIDIDLKTTKAIPSAPRADHIRQVALYRAARNRLGGVLYVSSKRSAYYQIDDDAMAIALSDLESSALSLSNFLARCDNKDDALKSLPIDWESWQAPKTRIPLAEILLAG